MVARQRILPNVNNLGRYKGNLDNHAQEFYVNKCCHYAIIMTYLNAKREMTLDQAVVGAIAEPDEVRSERHDGTAMCHLIQTLSRENS